MDNLAEKESIMIGPPAGGGGARHDIMLPGHQRINIIKHGKLSPTNISDRDSDPIGVRIPQT